MNTQFFGRKATEYKPFDIFVNQAGYLPDGVKLAVIPFPCERFTIADGNGEVFFDGETTRYGFDECSGDDVYIADFSRFSRSGSYHVAAGGRKSSVFRVGESVCSKLLDDVSKVFYYLRCGCDIEKEYAGKFTHRACHTEKALLWEDRSALLDVTGGWHDAGDYGRYVTAAASALAHILYAYKFFPEAFETQNLNIPESGSAMPDILSECKYELDWIIKMQRADGAVYHKVTTRNHAPFVMPEDDTAELYVMPVSSSAAADLCGVCALAAGIYEKYSPAFAEKLRKTAELSFEWLVQNPQFLGFKNPEGCNTGEYGEHDDRDNRLWAYAEMYALTGDKRCHEKFLETAALDFHKTDFGHGSVGGFGCMAYIFSDREDRDMKLVTDLSDKFYYEAEYWRETAEKSGYGAAMKADDYCWGSNMGLMKHAICFIVAGKVRNTDKFRDLAWSQLDVLLGKNPLGISYVTGWGEHCCKNPHYRPTAADGIDECIRGFVSGGPNAHYFEPVAKELLPEGTPPMKSYVDRVECYSLNEVAIYWNSAALFVLAYFAGLK